jgi:hypothetical protein
MENEPTVEVFGGEKVYVLLTLLWKFALLLPIEDKTLLGIVLLFVAKRQ